MLPCSQASSISHHKITFKRNNSTIQLKVSHRRKTLRTNTVVICKCKFSRENMVSDSYEFSLFSSEKENSAVRPMTGFGVSQQFLEKHGE